MRYSLLFAIAVLMVACSQFNSSGTGDASEKTTTTAKEEASGGLSEERIAYFEKQFQTKCARCHGKDAKGGGPNSAELEIPPRNLTDASYMDTRTDEQIFRQILEGGKDESPMPGFGPDSNQGWSEAKVWEMVRYVRLLSKSDTK